MGYLLPNTFSIRLTDDHIAFLHYPTVIETTIIDFLMSHPYGPGMYSSSTLLDENCCVFHKGLLCLSS